MTGFRRSTVAWTSERSPTTLRTCFGERRRLRGQKRVPRPPARITPYSCGTLLERVAVNQAEGASPARLGKKVLYQVDQVIDADRRICERLGGSIVGPVDDERLADDVPARNETPVAAVERGVAIVAHREITLRRDYDLAAHHVLLQHVNGGFGQVRVGLAGKVIAVGIDVLGLVVFVP